MANEQQLEPCLCNGKSVSRMFNPKQLRIYILHLLTGGINYGYELIKKLQKKRQVFIAQAQV